MSSEWITCDLGRVVTFQRGYDLPQRERRAGGIPIVTSSGTGDWHSEARVAGPGVVTGRYGTIGEVFFVEGDFWPLNTTLFVKDFHGNDPRFVSYLVRTIDFHTHSGKSGVPGVNRNDLHLLEIQIPASSAEQRAIAAALSDVDALLGGLDRLIAKKRDLKQAAMQQLLTGQTRLPGFSGKWSESALSKVIGALEAGVSVNSTEGDDGAGDEPAILKTSAVVNGRFLPEQCKRIASRDLARAKLSPRADTILISRMNTPDLVGECGYVDREWANLFVPDRLWMTRIRPDVRLSVRWLAYVLSSPPLKALIAASATGTSGSMKNLAKPTFLALSIQFPSYEEQRAIAGVLSDMDAELAALEARRDKTRLLKQGMMQELLTGRIRLV